MNACSRGGGKPREVEPVARGAAVREIISFRLDRLERRLAKPVEFDYEGLAFEPCASYTSDSLPTQACERES